MEFAQPVTLSLGNITLEPLSLKHTAGLQEAVLDGEIWRIRVTSAPEPENVTAYIENALAMQSQGLRVPFAVIENTSGRVLGTSSYHDLIPAVKRLEIGWTWYRKSVQRTHVNSTCKMMLMQHAFESLGCAVVGWRTDNYNFASQKAIERLGAKKDGIIRHHALRRDGTVRDTVIYSLLAGEWPEVKAYLQDALIKPR